VRISLRAQIFLWYSIAISLLIIGLAFGTQRVSKERLDITVDEELKERSDILAEAIINSPRATSEVYDDLIEWLTEQELTYVPAVLRISDPQRNVLASFGDVPDEMVPIMDRELVFREDGDGWFKTINLQGRAAVRLYTMPVYDPATDKTIVILQTGDSLGLVLAAQKQLWPYILAVGFGGSAVAMLVGWVILQRGLRPLDKILHRVGKVSSENLTTRIPDESRPPELQRLADTLNLMFDRLEEAFRSRETFVASVSHDLRTPLTILQTQLELMLKQGTIEGETRQQLNRMAREVRRLGRMTTNLLLTAQLETGPAFAPMTFDLRELIDEVAAEAKVLAEGLTFKVSAPDSLIISGDYDLLKQMLLNIADNAIQFTPRDGTIELKVGQEEDHFQIKVSDSGQGISAEHLPHVTEPFYRGDTTNQWGRRGGTGMGLAIVKRIVELHHGQMRIYSEVSRGTTVVLRLPLGNSTNGILTTGMF